MDLVRGVKDPENGARGMSGDQVLRVLILKQMKGFSYEDLHFHPMDSATCRTFCRFGVMETVPRRSTRRPVSEATVAQALATYVRSLLAGNPAFDRFRAGSPAALTVSAERGRQLFFGRARCSTCHEGANFTDERFEALGVPRTIPAASPPRGTRGMPETSRFRLCATWR